MTNDNYKTTDSALIDPREQALAARPRNVNIVLWLLIAVILIEGFNLFRVLTSLSFVLAAPRILVIHIISFAFPVVICHQIAHGRNWARYLLLLLTVVMFAQLCWNIGYVWKQEPGMWDLFVDPNYLVTRVLPIFINFAALHFLFFASGDWFRARGS